MTSTLLGNPHSASPSSQLSTSRIEDIRLRVLQFFHADPLDFDLIFVANATAGIKLVADGFRSLPQGFDYVYHEACHTSLVGVREEARHSQCVDTPTVDGWQAGHQRPAWTAAEDRAVLFAYPAQSNMDGRRFPRSWSSRLRESDTPSPRLYTFLDAAAFASTSPLDLSDEATAADFTVISFYKIFGFPDLGGLIVRRAAEHIFHSRKYFGGGTVDMVVCTREQWHAPKTQSLHDRLEDGTLPVHSIIALDAGLDSHAQLFGSMADVAAHTSHLARHLHASLSDLRHANGTPACRVYSRRPMGDGGSPENGPIVTFNLRNSHGGWVSLAEFEKLAALKKFHVRTGGVCNPGGIAVALGLEPWEMKRNFSSGFRCGNESDIMAGKPTGVIRISLGAMSTLADVKKFAAFVDEFYRDGQDSEPSPREVTRCSLTGDMHVVGITVYPIKSCGGFPVAPGQRWEVRPEGLAWDREWCLLHRGSRQALNQKRNPKMSLIRPSLDFRTGHLRISYAGELPARLPREVSVPLSGNPGLFDPAISLRSRSSRVCGEEISAQTYTSAEINNFFSDVLGVPCVLARFPPGGQGKSMRHSKAHLQKHQSLEQEGLRQLPGSYPVLPTPPDSDSEQAQRPILLSNESPILAINLSSLRALNSEIRKRGGKDVSVSAFRANVVFDSAGEPSVSSAYVEDTWSGLRIGEQSFRMLGSCRRCHMVCINQETAEKTEEPFVTLSKTRRFDGKVFFGTHMGHEPQAQPALTAEAQFPTIAAGDHVVVDG